MTRRQILEAIGAERVRQDAHWGGPEHDAQYGVDEWCFLLRSHVFSVERQEGHPHALLVELVQVAALAVAAIEALQSRQEAGGGAS